MEHDRQTRHQAFEQIVTDYQNLVYSVCLNIVKKPHDAENLAQETFLTAYSSLSGFRGGNVKTWLCRIAVNKSIDFKRRQSRFVIEDFDEAAQPTADSAEEEYLRRERRERLEHILDILPDKYISVIREFYYSEQTVKEIAVSMGLPERTVETRLYRAKKLIRERWGEYGA